MDAVRQGKNNRRKGFAFERELVNLFRKHGITASRSWGSDGRSRGEKKEVDVLLQVNDLLLRIQTKRTKSLGARYTPQEDIDLQIFRQDRTQPMVMMRLETLITLLRRSL